MSVDHGGVILARKDMYLEQNLSQCHFVHHRFYVDWPGMDVESAQWKTDN
jgi:hypothetical protein